jgi:2-keto-4-pentenoate hydratase/2-oxohepta-3-ene-1,7-dioic acid hydratase in catechol pathway
MLALSMKPTPQFLKQGDKIEITIDQIGTLRHGISVSCAKMGRKMAG